MISGARKVAILTILLNQRREIGSKLLGSLDKDVSPTVAQHMHSLGTLDPSEVKEIEGQFYREVGHILSQWIREDA